MRYSCCDATWRSEMSENAKSSLANLLPEWGRQGINGLLAMPRVLLEAVTLRHASLRKGLPKGEPDAGDSPVAILVEAVVATATNFRRLASILATSFWETQKQVLHLAGQQVNVSLDAGTRTVKWAESLRPRSMPNPGVKERKNPATSAKAAAESIAEPASRKTAVKAKRSAQPEPRRRTTEELRTAVPAKPRQPKPAKKAKPAKKKPDVAVAEAAPRFQIDMTRSPQEIAAQFTAEAVEAAKNSA